MRKQISLFNSNGNFGKGMRPNPYYNDPHEIITQMDRLGVSRSLVWHTQARDFNNTWGNRRLIEDIETSGAQNRLIPAFTISPTMLYEDGAMDELMQGILEKNVRALRIFPGALGHRISQLKPIIDKVRKLKPILLFDSKDSVDTQDLLDFAGIYPDVHMVYMQGMWNQLVTILDFLRARENILIDNSWLHTPESIEMIVQNFGANRILFGMGFKSHNGASIAALLHAEINEEARECIAHKNLDELLGIQDIKMDCEIPVSSPNGKNSLWDRFINDQNIGIDIIDAHGHLGASSNNVIKQNTVKKQVEYLSPLMEKINIKTLIVSSMQALNGDGVEGNKTLEKDMASCNNGNYLGYLSFNPYYGSKLASLFDEFFSRNFYIGFKLLCDYWAVPVTDSRFKPVWEYADKHRMPILLHTWEGNYDSPELLKDIAAEYSNAIFILGHSGGGDKGRREAIELAQKNGNVYLEFCGSFTSTILWEDTLDEVGSDRVVFGSDVVFHNPVWELGRVFSLNVSDETILPILSSNMKRILALRK